MKFQESHDEKILSWSGRRWRER